MAQHQVCWENRAQFLGVAASLMRRILVDSARRRGYAKRGGGAHHMAFTDSLTPAASDLETVIVLDDALSRLEQVDRRKSRVAELRLFSGSTVEETAAVLGVSAVTVMRDWRMAKAWLQRELRPA
jgi:RNA polymerase sigma factor (TIGR02999 family)